MSTLLTDRFEDALTFAFRLHNEQRRKGSETPYIAHLMGVSSIVLENGGDEDQAIAALLHDAVEDQGGLETLDKIQELFGDRVARIVKACSDSFTKPKPEWQERKEKYLASIVEKPSKAVLVILSDKLHNSRAILNDYRELGDELWERFKGGRDGTIWYYRSIVEEFKKIDQSPLFGELERTVGELEAEVMAR
jgi:GTP pyrophosphokinase